MSAIKRIMRPDEFDSDFLNAEAGFEMLTPVKSEYVECDLSGKWVHIKEITVLPCGKTVHIPQWYKLKRATRTLMDITEEMDAIVNAGHIPKPCWTIDAQKQLNKIRYFIDW